MQSQMQPGPYANPQPPRSGAGRLIAILAILACLYVASSVVMTLVVALLLFFVCDPAVTWLHRHSIPRGIGAFLMVLALLGGAYGLFYLFYAQADNFIEDLPKYSVKARTHMLRLRQKAQEIQKQTQTAIGEQPPLEAPSTAAPAGQTSRKARARDPKPVIPQPQVPQQRPEGWSWGWLGAGLMSITEVIFLVSFIPFLVYFLLTWKDHVRRTSIAIFGLSNRMAAERTLDGMTLMVRGFIFGNLIIGVILSLASGVFFWIMKLPYPAIMGPVSGFLSLVPYLGVLLAALPPSLAALGAYDTLSPLLAILLGVVLLHLLALNLLYPKLIGSRVHLNPVVVTVALMFWGWLWGAMGLILAIPITGVIKAVCDNVPSLKAYGRLMAD